MSSQHALREARLALDMTTTEAAALVHVSRRTFELWESGQRNIEPAKRELFFRKVTELGAQKENRELVVIFGDDGVQPLDVVASDTFAGLTDGTKNGYVIISSIAVNRSTGRPYVHRTQFMIEHNRHVLKKVASWSNVFPG
jgi:transcriptional regulator with XRE-family HTH domain